VQRSQLLFVAIGVGKDRVPAVQQGRCRRRGSSRALPLPRGRRTAAALGRTPPGLRLENLSECGPVALQPREPGLPRGALLGLAVS
jgi:hypothetical protein